MAHSKCFSCVGLVIGLLFLLSGLACAGGTVSYPDGSPAAGAQVIVTGGGQGKTVVICDAEGHFELGSIPDDAMVRIKTKDKDYAPLKLPASLFSSGDVAIVLQPKSTKLMSQQ